MEEYIRLFGDQKKKYFSYHVGRNRCQILEEEIQYFQCTGRKIQIVTKKGAGDAFYGSMTEVEKLVSVDKFWHIHKSYLVNRNYISSFQPMEVCLTDGTEAADQPKLQGRNPSEGAGENDREESVK